MKRIMRGLGAFLTLLLMMGGGTVTAYADTYVVLPNDPAMSLYFPHHDSVEFYESHSEGASKQPMILPPGSYRG